MASPVRGFSFKEKCMDLEFDIRQVARELITLYAELDAKKHERPQQKEVRTMRATPGPQSPGSWLWMHRSVDMEQKLREVAFNACADAQIRLRDDDSRVTNLLEVLALNAHALADLPWAADFLDELTDQARTIGKWVNPPDTRIVANADPYLTSDSIQRSLTSKGLACPEGTIRSWSRRGHVATKTRRDGRRAYRLADIIRRLKGPHSADHDDHDETPTPGA